LISLDAGAWIRETVAMIAQPYHIYIERTEPAKNMARYYAIEISGTLFGEVCVTRTWGRIGRRGQSKMEQFESEKEAVDLFIDLMRQKQKRGYRPKNSLREPLNKALLRPSAL
jgi:predicted DNA-binding WGR domain protein